jgi:hypothetical protein
MFSITINEKLEVGEILFEKSKAMSPNREEFLMEKVIPILQAFAQLINKSLDRIKKGLPDQGFPNETPEGPQPEIEKTMIELRVRIVPLPIVTDTIIHLDSREDMEPAKRFYEELILPSVKINLNQLEKEIAAMGLGMKIWQIAERRGLDPKKVIRNKKLSLQLLEEEENELGKEGTNGNNPAKN